MVDVSCECHYWCSATNCDLFLVLSNIIRVFFNVFLRNCIFFLFKRTSSIFSCKRKQMQCLEAATGRQSIKNVFFFARSPCCVQSLTCFAWEGYSHRTLFFPDYFTRDKNGFQGLFSNEFRYSCAINKFRSGTLHKIFSYWFEHLKVPGNCR